jgi:bifunctional enzyme CysN/CysC
LTSVLETELPAGGRVTGVIRPRPALRFLTCGSVDDGKSTLIGRLLYEQNLIFEDHLAALTRDSRKHGAVGAEIDFALLLDGLEAEREQGITIDVAYRYFATRRRAFIVADTPGHEQYTRNMATGASNCELAVLLVDARKGLLAQTRRHAIIASLLGIRHAVLAVNKIDLVDYAQNVFERIVGEFSTFAAGLILKDLKAVPVSARFGDNVSSVSDRTPWYKGPPLLDHLELVDVEDERARRPFRLPVQWVNRPDLDFRGFAGTIASGSVRLGDELAVLPSGQVSKVKSILGPAGNLAKADAGDAVTVTLANEIDIARGDILAPAGARPQLADQFAAHLVWMSTEPLLPGRSYLMKINHVTLGATVTELKHRIDTDSRAKLAAKTLALNEVGVCNLSVARPVPVDA